MERRHKALVVASTLFVVLSIVGFILAADALAHDNSKIHIRTADDASGVSVAYAYSFGGHDGVIALKDDAPLGSGHADNKLALEVDASDLVAADDVGEWADDDASGSASGYDDDEFDYDQYDDHAVDDQYDQDVDRSANDDEVDFNGAAQQTQQQQQTTQEQTPQQSVKLHVRTASMENATRPDMWPGTFDRCGVDRNVPKSCSKPTTTTELALYRAGRATARLEYFYHECSGVLLGNSPTNSYLLASADCVDPRAGMYAKFEECRTAKLYHYGYWHTLYHMNRALGYAILKVNSSYNQDMESISNYAKLSRRGAVVGTVVVVSGFQSIATTYELQSITIQTYKPIHVSGECKNLSGEGLVTYRAHSMDQYWRGSPVFSVADETVVALHMCGSCLANSTNTALSTKNIVEDLEAKGLLRSEFVAP